MALALTSQVANAHPSALHWRDAAIPQVGYISVSVATVWTDPTKPRPVDAPALTNPVHIEDWLNSMTLDQYLDLTNSDRTQTQALYGTRVNILSRQDGWYEVAVEGQPTPKIPLATQVGFRQRRYLSIPVSASFCRTNRLHWSTMWLPPHCTAILSRWRHI